MNPYEFPANPIAVAQTADGITKMCDDALNHARHLQAEIRSLTDRPDSELSWEVTFGAFDGISRAVAEAVQVPQLMLVAHPDAAVRQAAMACEPKVDAFGSALFVDDKVAAVLKRFAGRSTETSPVHIRFMEHVLREYRRNGLSLDASGREHLRVLNETITALGQQFEKHLAENTRSIVVTSEQLVGLPAAYIANHPADENGKIKITTDYPDFVPFMKYTKDRAAARQLYTESQNRTAKENLPLLDQLIELRNKKAKLLGYATWADYVLEPRMAKSAANVASFLQDLHVAIKPKREEEFVAFREAAASVGIPSSEPVFASDAAYLEDLICKTRFTLDSQRLSEYFATSEVLKGIFEIAKRLYGISFESVAAPKWHDDVSPFDLKDQSGAIIGRAYVDLYPRENKYKHAAVFGLRDTQRQSDGTRVMPIAALVCNFPKPGESASLLSHDEVTTFFHEFGHLLHHLVSTAELASFAGTNVARDFVEAPSQMFEEWAWKRETLDLFARHYKTGEKLPDDLFAAMTKARTFGEATGVERQIFLSALDQTYHTREPGFDTTEVMETLHREYSSFTRIPDTHFQAEFGHLVGYDAAYYGYQWARSLAFDLLTRFEKEGMMNVGTATDYRDTVLAPGSSFDENELVRHFLGREANADAYKRFLGISG